MAITQQQMVVLQRAHAAMSHARKFIGWRERMHPDGIQLYEEDMAALGKLICRFGREMTCGTEVVARTSEDEVT
jgi:hypothetical protein